MEAPEGEGEWREDLFNSLFANSPVGIFVVQDAKLQFVNSRFQIDTGYSEHELLGVDSLSLVVTDDRAMVKEHALKMLKGEQASQYEFRIVTKGGETRWVAGAVTPIHYGGKRAALGYYMDITDSKRLEQRLRESESLYKAVVENVADAIVINVGGTRVFVNQSFLDLHGLDDLVQATGVPMEHFIVPEDRELVRQRTLARQRGEEVPNVYEYRILRSDGEVRTVETSVVTTTYADQPAALAVLRDITERNKAQAELIRTERLRVVGNLSAGISHNLNNILVGVLGPAELIQTESNDPKVLKQIDHVIASTERARDLVQSLSQAAQGEDGDDMYPVQVREEVQRALQLVRPRWKDEQDARGVSIEIVTELEDTPSIRGTKSGLNDILVNLVLNAVDALPDGGKIAIGTRAVNEVVQLTVSDTGIGMDEETRRQMFEPFFTTKKDVGTGLGLYSVYSTVLKLGGKIDVESTLGKGTTFTIRFPAWAEQPEVQEEREDPVDIRQKHRGNILIVDDEEEVCRLLADLLAEEHNVVTVLSGQEAHEKSAHYHYDMAFIDLGLQDIPGDQLARGIKEVDPSVVTVLMTGWVLREDAPELSTFDFHLPKPFRLKSVKDIVIQTLKLRYDSAEGSP